MKLGLILANIQKTLKNADEGFDYWFTSLLNWFLADIAYTLLPIGIIIVIKSFISHQTDFLFLSPEWSFATIVTFGVAITSAVEVKTEYQKDRSPKVYILTRMLIILLIFAVLVLGLVVIRMEGFVVIDDNRLSSYQILLFLLSVFSLFVAHTAKEQVKRENIKFPKEMTLRRYYNSLQENLEIVNKKIISTKIALVKRQELNFNKSPNHEQELNIKERNRDLADLILRVEKNIDEA